MAYSEPVRPRRTVPLLLATAGVVLLAAAVAADPAYMAWGAIALAALLGLAIVDASRPIFTWTNALGFLVLVIWLMPIRLYRLDVSLPVNLEVYRVVVLILLVAMLVSFMTGRLQATAAGHEKPLVLLAFVAMATQIVNYSEIEIQGIGNEGLKSLSFFLSSLVLFVMVASAINSLAEARTVVHVVVAGAAGVALAAMVEYWTANNLFDDLDRLLPVLAKEQREIVELRAGRLRVYASSQHPIALGVALTMVVPLALYSAGYAATRLRRWLWLGAAGMATLGAFATVSRTVVVMAVVMAVTALIVRRGVITRMWPILLLLPFVVHFAAPGTIGGLYKSLFPEEGLVEELGGREGLGGSGRLADVGPGLDLWSQAPLIGHGLGRQAVTGTLAPEGVTSGATGFALIFDNQYLNSLVALGLAGIIGVVWFVWGAAIKLAITAYRYRAGPGADLVAACGISCVGFGASMAFFDAFSFVQATLVFALIAAIGLRVRQEIIAHPPRPRPVGSADHVDGGKGALPT